MFSSFLKGTVISHVDDDRDLLASSFPEPFFFFGRLQGKKRKKERMNK
jgi:hypothetical protein